MKKFYYLKTCDTCKRMMTELNIPNDFIIREIKSEPPTEIEIDGLAKKAGSYAAIFNKRARKYRELGLNSQKLTESDFKKYLLTDYTFLKRPVLETELKVIAGNSAKTIESMRVALSLKA